MRVRLHNDASLPPTLVSFEVESVRVMFDSCATRGLKFLNGPTYGRSGWFAVVRDAGGAEFMIHDTCDERVDQQAHQVPDMNVRSSEADRGASDWFGQPPTDDSKLKKRTNEADRLALARLYAEVARTADDLPYSPEFESLCEQYAAAIGVESVPHGEVWRQLLNLRKAGKLARLGAARSVAPQISDDEKSLLRQTLGDTIGRRDRLPYSAEFDAICDRLNRGRRRRYSPHQVWRIIATMAK
jgi:hypothetical protein